MNGNDDDETLRRDLEGALRFDHLLGMQTKFDVQETSATVYALMEELVARGVLDLRAFEARRERMRAREAERAREQAFVQIAPAVDKYALADLPQIDCAARISLCQGRCCRLSFPLSFQDLDERVVKWDYSRPYQIRRREDGYCTHSDEETRGCRVYENRPAICRTYDCRNDKRIWVDFDKRIPAPLDAAPPPRSK
jgi:Fe-S-cluster containining protein